MILKSKSKILITKFIVALKLRFAKFTEKKSDVGTIQFQNEMTSHISHSFMGTTS